MYVIELDDEATEVVQSYLRSRLQYMQTNISAYVEKVIVLERAVKAIENANHTKDAKPQERTIAPAQVKHNLCSKHPIYGAKRAPRTLECDGCWDAFAKYAGADRAAQARRKLERRSEK